MNKKFFDNTSLQSDIKWGNIQLPGMTDEELHAKNWNLVDAAKERHNNPIYKENKNKALREKAKDPIWIANQKIGALKRNTPERKENLKKYREKFLNDPNFIERRRIRNKNQINDPKYIEALHKGIEKRGQDPNFLISLQNARKERLIAEKGLLKCPVGIFLRQKNAADALNISVTTLQKRIKQYPNEYYYISQEEYKRLTGKEVWED